MEMVGHFFSWLFGTREGVFWLIGGGVALFLIVAFVLERRTKRRYFNHRKSENDWDIFDDDSESGWSDFTGDNN